MLLHLDTPQDSPKWSTFRGPSIKRRLPTWPPCFMNIPIHRLSCHTTNHKKITWKLLETRNDMDPSSTKTSLKPLCALRNLTGPTKVFFRCAAKYPLVNLPQAISKNKTLFVRKSCFRFREDGMIWTEPWNGFYPVAQNALNFSCPKRSTSWPTYIWPLSTYSPNSHGSVNHSTKLKRGLVSFPPQQWPSSAPSPACCVTGLYAKHWMDLSSRMSH